MRLLFDLEFINNLNLFNYDLNLLSNYEQIKVILLFNIFSLILIIFFISFVYKILCRL